MLDLKNNIILKMFISDTSMIEIKDSKYNRYDRVEERVKSFKSWPLDFISIDDLASNGFIYTGKKDMTCCVYCGVHIEGWEKDDTPNLEHRKHSPRCPFIRMLNDGGSTSGMKVVL